MITPSPAASNHPRPRDAPWAIAAWAAGWALMVGLEGRIDLANLALLLVLASALSSLWLPTWLSCGVAALSVLAFNWLFVPPKHTLSVTLGQHALMLAAMLVVMWIVAAALGRQRSVARQAQQQGQRVRQLHRFGEALRDSHAPAAQSALLFDALNTLLGAPPRLLVLSQALPPVDDDACVTLLGAPTPHERAGLWHCVRQAHPFGPGTGRHAELREWYFPLRGGSAAFGAAMVSLADVGPSDPGLQAQAQALCDQLGLVLHRAQAQHQADTSREEAQLQKARNAMLAAISHDFRTPLASILGAASALIDQRERLSSAQQSRLLTSIVEECRHLSRLTDNTLQLTRLDAPGVALTLDWESPQELAGAVLARFRARGANAPLRMRVEPKTPLVRCDALLMSQLLENLIDNALKYGGGAAVELLVRRQPGHVVLAVRDRGPGVAPEWRRRIFDVFQCGPHDPHASADAPRGRSAGVGLAVCRAIAQAHGGELRLRPRSHGGSSFECWLPEQPVPTLAAEPGNDATVNERVLLVEDDRELRATLKQALEVEGYAVSTAASAADAVAQWQHAGPHPFVLVLLDLGLPDADGAGLIDTFCRGRDTAVLVISARGSEADKVKLLDQGADDYLVKPFSIGELLARLRVALRHRGRGARPAVTRYSHQGLEVDLPAHTVQLDGQALHLTPTEFKLLARLVRSAGQVVTHRRLLSDVWGAEYVQHTHYLRLYMGQLRAKLADDASDPRWLLTEPGVGYRLVAPEPP